jgi:hypothetical protein
LKKNIPLGVLTSYQLSLFFKAKCGLKFGEQMSEKKSAKIKIVSEDPADIDDGTTAVNDTDPSADPDDPVADLQHQLQSREEELEQTHDRLLRVSAEFDNYKKRSARETADFRKYANQALLKDLLPRLRGVGGPRGDFREVLNAIFWLLRMGAP